MPAGDDSMHEKREGTEGCRPGLRGRFDQAVSRPADGPESAALARAWRVAWAGCARRGCREAACALRGHASSCRPAARCAPAASQALGLGSQRARRRGSGRRSTTYRLVSLHANRRSAGMLLHDGYVARQRGSISCPEKPLNGFVLVALSPALPAAPSRGDGARRASARRCITG